MKRESEREREREREKRERVSLWRMPGKKFDFSNFARL